jgi:hypothetical protein
LTRHLEKEFVIGIDKEDKIVFFNKKNKPVKEIPRNSMLLDVWPLENGNYLIVRSLNYYTELDSHKIPGFYSEKVNKVRGFFPRLSWSVSKKRISVGE